MGFEQIPYKPRVHTANYLNAADEVLNAAEVPYTLRGLFYVLLQREDVWGITSKKDWDRYKDIMAVARKRGYRSMRPWSLVDETRPLSRSGGGYRMDQIRLAYTQTIKGFEAQVAHWDTQDVFAEIWTESRGAVAQVSTWIEGLNIRAMGGDSSISENWNASVRLTDAAERYGKPLVVFTIGDLDEKGVMIPESALKDVRTWCPYDIEHVRVGLLQEHVERYQIPDKVDGKGYEWEALPHSDAKELITEVIGEYINFPAMADVHSEAKRIADELVAETVEKLGLEEE